MLWFSPMEYLRDYRLRQVYTELILLKSTFISVSEVATFRGCTHLGRFSQQGVKLCMITRH